jgi:hypothetical protein
MTSESDEVDPESVHGLLRELVFNRNGLALLAAVLIGVLLLVLGASTSGSAHTVVTGLGTGLVASSVFAGLFLLLVSRAEHRLLQSAIDTQADEVASTVVAQVQELQRRFIPAAVYQGSQEFNYQFNSDLTGDLEGTSRYIYYGLTGKYVGARLLNVRHRISNVDVVIGDPRSEDSARFRQKHQARPSMNGQIQRVLVEEVDHCIIGLYSARHLHDRITVYITETPNYDRVEVTDAAGYLTLFTREENRTFQYPETLRFTPEADFYEMMRRDADRALERSSVTKVEIGQAWTDDDLRAFYAEAFGRALSPDDLDELKTGFASFREDFDAQLRACAPQHH